MPQKGFVPLACLNSATRVLVDNDHSCLPTSHAPRPDVPRHWSPGGMYTHHRHLRLILKTVQIFVTRTVRRKHGFFFLPSSSTYVTNAPVEDTFLPGVQDCDVFQYDYPSSPKHRAWIRRGESWTTISEGEPAPFDKSLRLWLGHRARKASWVQESTFKKYSKARERCPCILLAQLY